MDDADLLLRLYRSAREQQPGDFEEAAVALLHERLTFDSALWGFGRLREDGGLTPHVVHLHRQPEEALHEWAQINVADPVAATCLARPGEPIRFHAPTLFAARKDAAMRHYARRWGRQSYMVLANGHPARTDLMSWLSLYRRDADAQFDTTEAHWYRKMMAHLQQAQHFNRLLHLQREGAGLQDDDEAFAIADAHGFVHTPWNDIAPLVQGEWAGCAPPRLPDAVVASLGTCSRWQGRTLIMHVRRAGGLLFLRMARRAGLDALSPRELQVAEVLAGGRSAKEAGREMGVSPATVRVHLKNIYAKLNLHSRAELAFLIGGRISAARSLKPPSAAPACAPARPTARAAPGRPRSR